MSPYQQGQVAANNGKTSTPPNGMNGPAAEQFKQGHQDQTNKNNR